MRKIERKYTDPTDLIWAKTAARMGLNVIRSSEVFASWDGDKTLTLSTPEHFDPDDCLAQLIFHEICHALIEGSKGKAERDWGLQNMDDSDLVREHACHRLQATLSQAFGLRHFFAVTTEWRPYYDALPQDPLGDGEDPAIAIARIGYNEFQYHPWHELLLEALTATALIAEATHRFADSDSLWASYNQSEN